MNICVIGSGYVGLVTGACFSEFGVNVACVDNNPDKIEALQNGEVPIYEPGLEDMLERNVSQGRLSFTSNTGQAIRDALVVFIAVGTPSMENGSTDLSFVKAVALEIGTLMEDYKVVVTKSTVPVGTSEKVADWIKEGQERSGQTSEFAVASNPEFLREGAAISDFMRPDRVVIGAEDEVSMDILKELYRPLFLNETPFVLTNIVTSELIKYAANAFLATKISFINEIANLCEVIGGDVQAVARGIGLDGRIGKKFLHAGPGFGGSCFPKDTRSVAHFSSELGSNLEIVEATIRVNDQQRARMVKKIEAALGSNLSNKTVCVLGLSFKPETDDVRDAPSIDIITELVSKGVQVRAFDPVAMEGAKPLLPSSVIFGEDAYEAAEGSDALVIITEWNQFRALNLARLKNTMKQAVMIDLRNIYDPDVAARSNFSYHSVGR